MEQRGLQPAIQRSLGRDHFRKGAYQFECRRFPRVADKKAGASGAEIRIGDHTMETDLDESDKQVTFELTLEAGNYDLEAWFANGKKRFGALWVYVKKL